MASGRGTARTMDRTEAAPLTSERRYGVYRAGLLAAVILIVVLVGIGVALIFGVHDATILLCVLLPLLILSAVMAQLFLWWQHKKAVRRRETAASEWVSTTLARQQQSQHSTPEQRTDTSWFQRFSQRASTRSTPPPGYHTVATN